MLIPVEGRRNINKQLHEMHSGVNKMKSLACSFVWWPGLDSDVETEFNKFVTLEWQTGTLLILYEWLS